MSAEAAEQRLIPTKDAGEEEKLEGEKEKKQNRAGGLEGWRAGGVSADT